MLDTWDVFRISVFQGVWETVVRKAEVGDETVQLG